MKYLIITLLILLPVLAQAQPCSKIAGNVKCQADATKIVELQTDGGRVEVDAAGDLVLPATGQTLKLHDGTAASACMGTSTLNGVTAVTVSTTCAATGARIFLTRTSDPTLAVPGSMWVTNIVDGVSFDIDADNATDDSTVNWLIIKDES